MDKYKKGKEITDKNRQEVHYLFNNLPRCNCGCNGDFHVVFITLYEMEINIDMGKYWRYIVDNININRAKLN